MEPVSERNVFEFALSLPARGQGNLTHELHQQLRAAILDGRLAAGAMLPATRQVAAGLGIARNTVVAAYDLLIAEGYVSPRQGAKAVVADVAARRDRRAPRTLAPGLEDARLNPLWRTPFLRPDPPRQLPERCFRLGIPDHRHFPHDVWRRLSAQTLRAWSKTRFSYPPSEGIAELRHAIAQHVAFARAVACTGDDVVVTSGAQQAFDLLARLLVTPGETRVAVEEPGYPPIRAAFAAAGARLAPMPVDEEGLCVDRLPDDVRVVSVTPSHQSPTGVALSLRRRRALLDFARQRNALVIEDDYDGEFRYGARPLDALQTLDREGRVVYVGTFSKSLFPSLRMGYAVAPEWLRDALAAAKEGADTCGNAQVQDALADFILEGHLARHVRRMRRVYAGRREALFEMLDGPLSRWFSAIPSEAGIHVAARFVHADAADALLPRVREHAAGAMPLRALSQRADAPHGMAFGIGCMDEAGIRERLRALAKAVAR